MTGPFLIQLLVGHGTYNQRWMDIQWEDTLEQALAAVLCMAQSYECRLYCGPTYGCAKLVWVPNPNDPKCSIAEWQF